VAVRTVTTCEVHLRHPRRTAGYLELERARVRWFLSADAADLPFAPEPGLKTTFRSITVDGDEVEFSDGFTDLHTRVYEEVLAGRGFRIDEGRPAIELTYRIRTTPAEPVPSHLHPALAHSAR
jgi:UDP-N-acetyl-2-amino-2-deoxyglucuronate dehydrogenase